MLHLVRVRDAIIFPTLGTSPCRYIMGKLPDVGTIGLNAMYEIATLPEERRQDAINEDGTAKSVSENVPTSYFTNSINSSTSSSESSLGNISINCLYVWLYLPIVLL